MAGSFSTSCEAEIKIKLPELSTMAHIFAPFHVTSQKSIYNVIFGRDILREVAIQDSKNIKSTTNRFQKILDAKYQRVRLKEITNKLKHFN